MAVPRIKVGPFLGEFKKFAFKGNMIDLAVGVVIGAAFGTVVDSVVKNVILPLVSYIPGLGGGYENWMVGKIAIGKVLASLLNFVLVAAAVFIVIVKVVGALAHMGKKPELVAVPTTKDCPKCLFSIPIAANKCGHCTSDLTENFSAV